MRRRLGRLPRATLGGQPKLRRPGQAAAGAGAGAKSVVATPRLRAKLLLPRPASQPSCCCCVAAFISPCPEHEQHRYLDEPYALRDRISTLLASDNYEKLQMHRLQFADEGCG